MTEQSLKELLRKYVTSIEARRMLGISRQRLSQLCLRGQLPGAIRSGGGWLIPRAAVARRKKFLELTERYRRKLAVDKDL